MADDAVQPAAAALPATQADTMEITLGDGHVFKGTKEEVIQKLGKSVESGSAVIRDQTARLEQLETRLAELSKPAATGEPQFSQQVYFDKLSVNAVDAQEYLNSFSPTTARLAKAVNDIYIESQVGEFYSRIAGGEAALDQSSFPLIVKRLNEKRWPSDADHLELACNQLVKEGKINLKPKEEDVGSPAIKKPPARPETPGLTKTESAAVERARTMPFDELEADLRRQGLLQ